MIQIDMQMPERCGVCFAMHTDEIGLESWCGIDETARDLYTADINTKRPEWCPLKEQETTVFKPHYIDKYSKHFICGVECGACHKEISSTYHYCPYCGKEVKWE